MKVRQIGAVTAASVLALGLAACGDSGPTTVGSGSGGGGGKKFKIGIKFDQPGLGLKAGSEYTGLDVDVATYVAKELGHEARATSSGSRPRPPQRETLISDRTGRHGLRDLLDHRRPQGEGLLRRAVLHRRPGPAGPHRRHDRITGPETLDRQEALLGQGLDLRPQKVKDKYPGVQLQEFGTYSECVTALVSKGVDALTTDNTILAGYASQEQYKGKLKVVGKTVLRGALSASASRRATPRPARRSTPRSPR